MKLMLVVLGNAKIVGLQKDLDMTGVYDYNQLASLFYVSYIIFEVPSNLACKWIGPGWFLPFLTLGFGAMSLVFAYVQNLQQACAVRFLLGMFESGVMPGMSYYLSRWYDTLSQTLAQAANLTMMQVPQIRIHLQGGSVYRHVSYRRRLWWTSRIGHHQHVQYRST